MIPSYNDKNIIALLSQAKNLMQIISWCFQIWTPVSTMICIRIIWRRRIFCMTWIASKFIIIHKSWIWNLRKFDVRLGYNFGEFNLNLRTLLDRLWISKKKRSGLHACVICHFLFHHHILVVIIELDHYPYIIRISRWAKLS